MKNILKNKPKRSTIQQLQDLKSWSQNPTAYEKKLKFFLKLTLFFQGNVIRGP